MKEINFNDTIVSNNRFVDKLEKFCIIKGRLSLQVNSIQGSGPNGLVLVTKLNVYKDELKKIQEEKNTASQLLLEYEEKIVEIENEQAGNNAYRTGK